MIKTLSSTTIYQDQWATIFHDQTELTGGEHSTYTYINRADDVFVLLVNQNQEILLQRQFRYPLQALCWEIPGGGIDEGEDPANAAVREVEEETGIQLEASQLTPLLKLHLVNGLTTNLDSVYTALVDNPPITKSGDANEDIVDIRFIPLADCLRMIDSHEITDGATIAALLKFALNQKV